MALEFKSGREILASDIGPLTVCLAEVVYSEAYIFSNNQLNMAGGVSSLSCVQSTYKVFT